MKFRVLSLGSVSASHQVTLTSTDMHFILSFLSEAYTRHMNMGKKKLKWNCLLFSPKHVLLSWFLWPDAAFSQREGQCSDILVARTRHQLNASLLSPFVKCKSFHWTWILTKSCNSNFRIFGLLGSPAIWPLFQQWSLKWRKSMFLPIATGD